MTTFNESFDNTTYKDAVNTTADWNTTSGTARLNYGAAAITQQYDDIWGGVSFGTVSNVFSGVEKAAQSFQVQAEQVVSSVKLRLCKSGSPTDNVHVKLYSGLMTGSPSLLETSSTVAGSSLSNYSTFTEYTFTFSSGTVLSSGTDYSLVVERDGSLSDSNFYFVQFGHSGYAYGTSYSYPYTTHTWTSFGLDFYFKLYARQYNISATKVQSLAVDSTTFPIVKATLTATQTTPATSSIAYYMTADGTNWEAVTSGVSKTFANPGSNLKWYAILTSTTGYTPYISSLAIDYTPGQLTDPENAYADDASYATCLADDGVISVSLSKDAGSNFNTVKSKTFNSTEATQTYGGAGELWGATWGTDDINNTNFRMRVQCGTAEVYRADYKDFGLSIPAGQTLTGIEVTVKAKRVTTTTSINHIQIKVYYGTSTIAVSEGAVVYTSDGGTDGTVGLYNSTGWTEMVGIDTTQTLTNKTLTAPTINGASVTGTIAYGDNAPNIAPKARAKRSGNQTIGSGSWTKVQLDTETFDVGGDFDNDTNYRFTAPVTGYYQVNTLVTWSGLAGSDFYVKIYKNGTGIITASIHGVTSNATSRAISDLVYLEATNYVELYVYQNSGGNKTITGDTYMSVHLLSI